MAWSNFRPAGDSKITRVLFAPQSFHRLKERFRLQQHPRPAAKRPVIHRLVPVVRPVAQIVDIQIQQTRCPRARLMMLSSSGPANIAGNKVSTSIFIRQRVVPRTFTALTRPDTYVLSSTISTEQRTPFLALPGEQQRPDGVDRHALPADDLADVLPVQRSS